ncbi:MAG: hypothetical protein WAM28_07720 [Chlamydiales bacterium]
MRISILLLLCCASLCLQAQYQFDETVFIPLKEGELEQWKIEHQQTTQNGISSTRYIPSSETTNNWTKLLNIKFHDRSLLHVNTALEAMQQEQTSSPRVLCSVLNQHPNDLTYERAFPTGEHELVRMIMTKKGLHRISYVKRGPFDQEERNYWLDRLMSSVVGK